MADIDAILKERGSTHGPYEVHATITQNLKRTMQEYDNWYSVLTDAQREALDMTAHKIGRILAGNPNVEDHWDDIAGYCKLASKDVTRLKEQARVDNSWVDAALKDNPRFGINTAGIGEACAVMPLCQGCHTPMLCTSTLHCSHEHSLDHQ